MEQLTMKDIVLSIMDEENLTQSQFATKYRLDSSQVSRWISGKQQPRIEVYLRMRMVRDELLEKKKANKTA